MQEPNGLTDPRETKPEMGESMYAMQEPPDRMELLADLLRETRRIENHTRNLERSNDRLYDEARRLRQEKDELAERVVKAETALVACEGQDSAIQAAVYMEGLDEDYVKRLMGDIAERSSF